MNFFNVDFAKCTTALFKEAFKFKKYKAMPAFFAVFFGLFQIPFVAVSFVMAGLIYALSFVIKLFTFPLEQIHAFVRNEKDEVKAGAQTIIYLVSWPFIFIAYAVIVGLSIILNIYYMIAAIFAYLWSFGGFRFHLLPENDKDIEKKVEGKYGKVFFIVFLIVLAAVLVLLPIVLTVMFYLDLPKLDQQYVFKTLKGVDTFKHILNVYKGKLVDAIPFIFATIYGFGFAAIAFPRASKKSSAVADVIAESAEEARVIEEAPAAPEAPADEEAPTASEAPVADDVTVEN